MLDLFPPSLVCLADLVDHCAEQIKSTNLPQSGEGMCLFTSKAPLGWEHLLSHPNNLGSGVKANETGFCVCTSCCPRRCEQQTENTFKTLKSEQTGGVRSASFFPCLLKRCLVARQLMAELKGVNFAQINLL